MSDVDVFVIDDDFDPLADLSLDDGERDDAEADYLPPIPDADKSVVPPVVPLSATERIEKLLAGIPGRGRGLHLGDARSAVSLPCHASGPRCRRGARQRGPRGGADQRRRALSAHLPARA